MAVPETSPPVPVAQNLMHMLAQTLVPGDAVHRAVKGHFRQRSVLDIVLAREASLALASTNEEGTLTTHHQQPVHATVLDLHTLHGSGRGHVQKVPLVLRDFGSASQHSGT